VLGAAALETAWVPADKAVLDGGGEDGFEQPVGLGRGDRAESVGNKVSAPAANVSVIDRANGLKSGSDVAAEQVAVELDRLRPKAGPFLDPDLGVLGERTRVPSGSTQFPKRISASVRDSQRAPSVFRSKVPGAV
jgi:hypothetical protein